MGAYLYFKTDSNPEEVANYLINESLLNIKLNNELNEQSIYIYCDEDILWAKEEHPNMLDLMRQKRGTGELKTSGGISQEAEEQGYSYEDIAEIWVQIFEDLNQKFDMKYYARSCSLNPESGYFTIEQMKRITNFGKLLSGKNSSKDYVREEYKKLFDILKNDIPAFSINELKPQDKVLLDDDTWYEIKTSSKGKILVAHGGKYSYKTIKEVLALIKEHRKFTPKIYFGGANAFIESYVKDERENIVFLEITGQEQMVRSISSIIMQGRMSQDDDILSAESMGYFTVNKAGNKRKIKMMDGIAHAILYHAPSVLDNNFNVILGRDEDELISSFEKWLNKSQPLPYPKEHTKKIYKKLQDTNKMIDLNTFRIKAKSIDLSILEDDYKILAEIIIEVCKETGLIDPTVKPPMPLPKSPYLTEKQVAKIFDTLNSMPKTYELENEKIKPIGLKLFCPNYTVYIVEADKGSEEDEYINMHTQCFAYIKNESDPTQSEWGYFNVPANLELKIPINTPLGQNFVGFEQDLFFENKYINQNGKVGTKEYLESLVAIA